MRYGLLALLMAAALPAADRGITATSASPHVKLRSVNMDEVRWTGGFWGDRFELSRRVLIPALWDALQLPANGASYRNFLVLAGLEQGECKTTWWSDGDFYKWIETLAHVYASNHDPALDRRMDEVIAMVAKVQAEDGYISTPIQMRKLARWQNLNHHELYNMGHLITAACIHHRATGKDSFLKVARKNADYLYKVFQPPPPKLAHFCFDPSQIMGLVELYRTTREPRYLELAGIFVDMRGSRPGGTDENQTHVAVRDETEAVGHAVTGPYLWAGAADVYGETGEQKLFDALSRIWTNATTRKMYVTGAVGAVNFGGSFRRDSIHEAFGLEYELPNRVAYNETCANIANGIWNWRMLAATGDARYADVMELVFYNSMLSGMGLEGKDYFYANPLRRLADEMPTLKNESLQRWSNSTVKGAAKSWCCPPNVSRMLASTHEYAYGVLDGAVWVNLYGSNTLKSAAYQLKQESGYPWDGAVRITVEKAGEFALKLRVPGWADGATLKVNGQAQPAPAAGRYAEVRRRWSAGDKVELALPMNARLVTANPAVEAARNQVAVMRGPLVYCLESPDLPAGTKLNEVALAADAKLESRFVKDLLGGVAVLEGEARVRREPAWGGLLYQTLRPAAPRTARIRLIPYYAWANRGVTYMTVWLPLSM